MLSVANIPLLGLNFEGLIAYLIVNGKAYRLATYTEVFMRTLKKNHGFTLIIKRGWLKIHVDALIDEQANLVSPQKGLMMNIIKEGLGGQIAFRLY